MSSTLHPAVLVAARIEGMWSGGEQQALDRGIVLVRALIEAGFIVGAVGNDGVPASVVNMGPETPETDAGFRKRILFKAGRHSIHRARIETDIGSSLDEVGAFYGLTRGTSRDVLP